MKENKTVITSDAGMEYEFVYDYSIWSCDPKHPEFVGQEKLYKLMGQPLLNSAFEGYNTCLFAYGQVRLSKNNSYIFKREVCCLGPLIWRRVDCPRKKGYPPTRATVGTLTISLQTVASHLREKQRVIGFARRVTCLARSPLFWWGNPPSRTNISRYIHFGLLSRD